MTPRQCGPTLNISRSLDRDQIQYCVRLKYYLAIGHVTAWLRSDWLSRQSDQWYRCHAVTVTEPLRLRGRQIVSSIFQILIILTNSGSSNSHPIRNIRLFQSNKLDLYPTPHLKGHNSYLVFFLGYPHNITPMTDLNQWEKNPTRTLKHLRRASITSLSFMCRRFALSPLSPPPETKFLIL